MAARQPAPAEPPCFIVAGHGRSGTSLVTAMLQSAGVDIGARLMGASEGNAHGHFEDLDFYEFHLAALRARGLHETGFVLEPSVPVPDQLAHRARDLVRARVQAGRPWGWKDPRTTLFLDFWQALVPHAHFVLLFRAPWEVVDSVFRRGDSNFGMNPGMAVRVWLNYNHAVLDFCGRHRHRCLLAESYAVARAPARLSDAIAQHFGHYFGLAADLYDEPLYRREVSRQHRAVLARAFPEALALYEELRHRADVVAPEDEPPYPGTPATALDDWALQDWCDCRAAERQVKQLRVELERARREHQETQVAANQLRAAGQIAEAQLQELQAQAGRLRAELEAARQRGERAEERVRWMESSRFWKLRRWWLRLRHPCGGRIEVPNS